MLKVAGFPLHRCVCLFYLSPHTLSIHVCLFHLSPSLCLFLSLPTHTLTPPHTHTLSLSSQATYRFIRSLPANHDLVIAPRGHIDIKGKGKMKTFLVLGTPTLPGDLLLPDEEEEQNPSSEIAALRMQAKVQRAMRRGSDGLSDSTWLPSSTVARPRTADATTHRMSLSTIHSLQMRD